MAAAISKLLHKREAAAVRSRRRDGIEIAVAYGLILVVLWMPPPWQQRIWWVAATTIAIIIIFTFEGLNATGLRGKGFLHSLWFVFIALVIAAGTVLLAHSLHTLHLPKNPRQLWLNCCGYALWSFVQQFLLQGYFLLRLTRLFKRRFFAALAAAILFALAHLPNLFLMPITLIWGLISCLLFLRYRDLYSLALVHATFGIIISISVPEAVNHHMRVGHSYLTYTPSHAYVRSSQP